MLQKYFSKIKLACLISLLPTIVDSQNFNYVWHHGSNYNGSGYAVDVVAKPDNTLLVAYNASNYDLDPSEYSQFASGCTIAKYDQQRRLKWYVSMGGYATNLTTDRHGNIYIIGQHNASFDADPGPGVVTLTPSAQSGGYIIELDSTGHFIWAYLLNSYQSTISSICFDDHDNLYIYSSFRGTLDIDPSTAIVNIISGSSGNSTDILLLKLSANKNLISNLHLFGITLSALSSGDIFFENNILYTSGNIYGGVNFNPLGAANTLNSGGSSETFVAKYDTTMHLIKTVLWVAQNYPHISSAGRGNVLIAGSNSVSFDADPSAAVHTTSSGGLYLINLDTALNYHWCFSITSSYNTIKKVIEAPQGNILLMGEFTGTLDFDPGAGSFPLSASSSDPFLGNYDSNGNFLNAINVSSGYYKNINNMTLGVDQKVFLPLGLMGTTDLDPGSGVVQYTTTGTTNKPLLIEYSLCQPTYTTISSVICKDEGYTFGDSTFFETGVHHWIYNSPGRCDSIVTLNLTIHQPDSRFLCTSDTLTCINNAGSTYQWFNCTDNVNVSGQTNSYYFPPDNDAYSAIINSGGCTETTQCVQRLQGSNSGIPVLAWGSYWRGGANFGRDRPLITDQYGNFYVAGSYYNTPLYTDLWSGNNTVISTGASDDVFIAKYNTNGIFQWVYHFGSTGTGGENDEVNSIAVDDQGNVFATGYYTRAVDFDPSENTSVTMPSISSASACCQGTGYILKLNPAGQFAWVKTFGKDGLSVTPYTIAIANNGNIAIGGDMQAGTIDFDPGPGIAILNGGGFFAEYDNSGNYIAGMALPESASGVTECTSVIFDSQNNLIVAGTMSANTDFDPGASTYTLTSSMTDMNYFLAKYSSGFNFMWAKKSGSHSTIIYPKTTLQTDCDDIIYVMRFSSLYKFSVSGTQVYQYPLSATSFSTTALAFDLDYLGNVYVTSMISGTVTLQPGKTLSTGGVYKKLVAKYNKNGSNAWGFLLAENSNSGTAGIASDKKGNTFVIGQGASGAFDIDPSASAYNLNTGGLGYVAKYGTTCSAIDTIANISSDTTTMHVTANAYYVWKRCWNKAIVKEGLVPQFTPDSAGYYYCVIHMGTCSDSTSCKHLVPIPGISISSTPLNICPNNPITFTASIIGISGTPHYHWFLNGSVISGQTNNIFTTSTLNNGDHIYCTVTDSIVPILILNSNILTANIFALPNNSITAAGLTLTATQNSANYQWLDCNNSFSFITGETNQSYTASNNGSFAVIVNYNGCKDTSSCYSITQVGLVENTSGFNVSVFPTPIDDNITIDLKSCYSDVTLEIDNIIGQVIKTNHYSSIDKINISIDGSKGLYYIKIKTGSGNRTTIKVLKN